MSGRSRCLNSTKRVLVIKPQANSEDFIAEVHLDGTTLLQMQVDAVDMRLGFSDNFWVRKYKEAVAERRLYSALSLEE